MLAWLVVAALLVGSVDCLDNGLALTPPMGWISWERFRCNINCTTDPYNCISEKLYMDMADRLVQDGYRDLGYEYVNIDDCWDSLERDSEGRLQPDPERFPSGIKFLSDYMHSRGLKLGIYGDIGEKTCGGYPGTSGHIEIDAQTYAEWGIDMLKVDGCYANASVFAEGYPALGQALNATGRPIVYSCSWPDYIPDPDYTTIAKTCNLWRNHGDIQDSWESLLGIILYYADNQDVFGPFAGPGQWNDPDQLIIGDFGLSLDQQMTQMAMWAIYASPLLMSNDLRNIPEESRDILQNQEVIDVNQDKLGIQGRLISSSPSSPEAITRFVFSKPLSTDSVAVAFLNADCNGMPFNMNITLKDAGLSSDKAMVRDLFEHRDLGVFETLVSLPVNPSGGVRLLLLTPISDCNK